MSTLAKVRKVVLWLLFGIIVSTGVASTIFLFEFWLFLRTPASVGVGRHEVEIRPGMDAVAIARLLKSRHVISDAQMFHLLCWLRKAGHKLRAGDYAFSSLSTPEQILDQIVSGRAILHRVTLPEGSTIHDVARILEQTGLVSGKDVMDQVKNPELIRSLLGLPVTSLEGYLFPETYHFQRIQSLRTILRVMVQEFWRHLPDGWQQRVDEMGLKIQDVVTLASVVEKEAVVDKERSLIAAVFHNRLKAGMPLQSDPTTVYDLPGFSGSITPSHLKRQSPYNTYLNKGLPAGPICSPGAKSLKAVLYPEKVPYLYFVSKNDGTHYFSVTLNEHNQAVLNLQQKRRIAVAREKAVQLGAPQGPSQPWTHGIGILERKTLDSQ